MDLCENTKCKKSYVKLSQLSEPTSKPNIPGATVMVRIWCIQKGSSNCELHKKGKTITGDLHNTQLIRGSEHCIKNVQNMKPDMKMFGHMLQD